MDQYIGILWIVGLGAMMYFMTIRPQRKQQKEKNAMMEALKRGDRIVTVGGFYGIVRAINDQRVTLEIASEIYVQVAKSAIASVVNTAAKDIKAPAPDELDGDEEEYDDEDYEIDQDD
ncbi:MAG: preprotein translocase subunit YajC [Clostridiales bacterium]|nr:preprotein translocase subunit YajC [Clostridiales bacterium]